MTAGRSQDSQPFDEARAPSTTTQGELYPLCILRAQVTPLLPRASHLLYGVSDQHLLDIYRPAVYQGAVSDEMREPTFFILLSLAGGTKHGYAVITDTERLSRGRVQLRAGTLYAAIERLILLGWVREAGVETVNGRARRYIEITDVGRAALREEAEHQHNKVSQAAKILDIKYSVSASA